MSVSHTPSVSTPAVPDRRFLRWMWRIAVGAIVAFLGLVAIAHTSWGRPLLALLTGVPGCPVGLDDVSGPALEEQRQRTLLSQNKVSKEADALPAHDFQLGTTPFADAATWAQARALRCEAAREGLLLRCSDLKLTDNTIAYEVDLHSDIAGRLVAYDVGRRSAEAAVANGWFGARADNLASFLGVPDRAQGQAQTQWLAAAPFRQRLIEYRRRNYRARVSVTHLNRGGYAVREQYQWAELDVASR